MNMPGMAGEAAIYRTNNYYRATVGGSLTNNGNIAVIPQDCGILEGITCGIYVGATVVACGLVCAACAATAVACPVCAACVLVGGVDAYIACRDCLPGSITKWVDSALMGGDGGGPRLLVRAARQVDAAAAAVCHFRMEQGLNVTTRASARVKSAPRMGPALFPRAARKYDV